MLHNPETLTSCFLQPEQDHEVHVGSPKSGREAAAAAAATEQAAMQLVRSCGATLLLARPLYSCLFPSAERHLWHSTPMLLRWRCAIAFGHWRAGPESVVFHCCKRMQEWARHTWDTWLQEAEAAADEADAERPSAQAALQQRPPVPKLAICIMVAGTRGDVQPFIALGLGLKARNRRNLKYMKV
jgi:hypothetical protein